MDRYGGHRMSTAPSFNNDVFNEGPMLAVGKPEEDSKPFSSIDAMEILEKTLSITEELISLVAKRTEFYREPAQDDVVDAETKRRGSSGMTDMIMHNVERVENHNRTLNYILNTLR